MEIASASAPSIGHCNTMGTASTMNALAEALGMSLPGCAAIPAPYRERGQIAYDTGLRAVEIVKQDLKPSDILTRKAFENTIVANSAIGGSTNAPIHINAIARHVGVKLSIEDWEKVGYDVPLLARPRSQARQEHGQIAILDVLHGASPAAKRASCIAACGGLELASSCGRREYRSLNLSRLEIACELSVSPNTVNAHIRSIYAKLDVRVEGSSAVRCARELRLLGAIGRTR